MIIGCVHGLDSHEFEFFYDAGRSTHVGSRPAHAGTERGPVLTVLNGALHVREAQVGALQQIDELAKSLFFVVHRYSMLDICVAGKRKVGFSVVRHRYTLLRTELPSARQQEYR